MQGMGDLSKGIKIKDLNKEELKEQREKSKKLMKESFEFQELVAKRQRKQLTKRCDNGSIDSCFDLEISEYFNRKIASIKEMTDKLMD